MCVLYVLVCLFERLTVVLLLVVGDSVYLQILYTKEMKLNTCSVLFVLRGSPAGHFDLIFYHVWLMYTITWNFFIQTVIFFWWIYTGPKCIKNL